jgi:lipopolysaccharide transport system permease protein
VDSVSAGAGLAPRLDHELSKVIIEPAERVIAIDLRELWSYRELLFLLVWRDVTVRYKQSVVGIGWAVIQPVLTTAIFALVFGRFAKLPSQGLPYPVFAFCGLLPWSYFARSLTDSSNSLVGFSHLITKVYFPRLILPLSRVIAGLVELGICLLLLAAMMSWYGIAPSWRVLLLPALIATAMFTSLAVGLWLTALNVRYRDVAFVVPFLVQLWMYASPVAYSSEVVPAELRWAYGLNPMVGVVEGFRWALLGTSAPRLEPMLASLAAVILIFLSGLAYFRRMERTFADII